MQNQARTQAVLIHIPQRAFAAYLEADEEIARRVGSSPGPHVLMAQRFDASDDPQEMPISIVTASCRAGQGSNRARIAPLKTCSTALRKGQTRLSSIIELGPLCRHPYIQ